MPKLTANFIATKVTPPAQGQVIIRDDELAGFALRVTKGSIAYIAECRVKGINRRVTIGRHGTITPEEARKQARVILGKMAAGQDLRRENTRQKAVTLTLGQAIEEYMESKDFRRNTRLAFARVERDGLGDWLNKRITSITKAMVLERYKELGSGSKKGTSGMANANLTMQLLSATINYISLKYEVEGEPLLQSNPVRILRQMKMWYKFQPRQGVIPDHKLADYPKFRTIPSTCVHEA